MKKLSFLILFLLLGAASAQNVSMSDVVKFRLNDSGAIIEDNLVKGYFSFYQADKADKKNYNYVIQLYDENLSSSRKVDMIRPKSTSLLEACYNSSVFAFIFYDSKAKLLETVTYDKALNLTGKFQRQLTKNQAARYSLQLQQESGSLNTLLYPAGKEGFITLYQKQNDKPGYAITYLDNKMSQKWEHGSPEDSKDYYAATFADADENLFLANVSKYKNRMGKDAEFYLLALDNQTGKEAFKIYPNDTKYTTLINSTTIDSDRREVLLMGDYYELGANVMKAKSLGYFLKVYDFTGKLVKEKFLSWENDMSKFIPVNKKGKMDRSGFIFLHKTVRTSDGKLFFVGEQFKKSVDGTAVAANVGLALLSAATGASTSSNAGALKMNILDMMVFQLSADFEIEKIDIFEKSKSGYNLNGAGAVSTILLGRMLKAEGAFDYSYTQTNRDASSFMTVYIDYDKKFSDKTNFKLGAITYKDGQLKEDKMELPARSDRFFILPAKPGYVYISEYIKKEKRVDSRLEKINF